MHTYLSEIAERLSWTADYIENLMFFSKKKELQDILFFGFFFSSAAKFDICMEVKTDAVLTECSAES